MKLGRLYPSLGVCRGSQLVITLRDGCEEKMCKILSGCAYCSLSYVKKDLQNVQGTVMQKL
jgi:gamma-glutamyl-gamma-aminobutyrate hydrolase PuuD